MRMNILSPNFAGAALFALALGCSPSPEPAPAAADDSVPTNAPAAGENAADTADVMSYSARGIVREVYIDGKTARISHEEIPGYMAAMTMTLRAKDANELDGVVIDDIVTFDLNVSETESWIDNVEVVAHDDRNANAPQVPGFRLVRDVDPLEVGDLMPNFTFTNELGRAVSLSDHHGDAIAITFIFTRCPLPDFCPRMSSNMREAHAKLQAKSGDTNNWHLFSLTIDPEFDTPEVLKNYAESYAHDPEKWNYLRGSMMDTTAIGELFGLEFYNPDGTINHNLRTVVIDAEGRVHHIIIGNTWSPDELVEQVLQAAAKKPE